MNEKKNLSNILSISTCIDLAGNIVYTALCIDDTVWTKRGESEEWKCINNPNEK